MSISFEMRTEKPRLALPFPVHCHSKTATFGSSAPVKIVDAVDPALPFLNYPLSVELSLSRCSIGGVWSLADDVADVCCRDFSMDDNARKCDPRTSEGEFWDIRCIHFCLLFIKRVAHYSQLLTFLQKCEPVKTPASCILQVLPLWLIRDG